MAYYAPYIDTTGLHTPSYEDIRDDLISQMKDIYGNDIYLGPDTQDYQLISIFAKKIYDTNNLGILVYNNRTPNTAVGIGLDNLCALVGITRKPATYSSVQLTITGDAGTTITNGQATDGTYIWDLPETVTIPENGTIIVQAISHKSGKVTALPNTINTIYTPTFGWLSVTNTQAATPGTNVESDMELRGRYAYSTYTPSASVFEGILAAVSDVEGVSRTKGYENDTGDVSSEGHPAHSITMVVEGGNSTEIAEAIYFKKTPGCYTNGNTEVQLMTTVGNPIKIRFERPTSKECYIQVTITALNGWSSAYEEEIKQAILNYINNMEIAETVYRSSIFSVAMGIMPNLSSPAFSVTSVKFSDDGESFSSDDFEIAWNEVSNISLENITIEVE